MKTRSVKIPDFSRMFAISSGSKSRLKSHDPSETAGISKKTGKKLLEKNIQELTELQELLYAEHKRSLLLVLQGMDTSGKDGTIKHVMGSVNPQGCTVTSFKVPTKEEADHDFLWRIHRHVPPKGMIGIFNRSHYEDVLAARVNKLVSEKTVKERYKQINDFERMLTENNVVILKFFLNISKEEQKERLEERLSSPEKTWKFDPMDLQVRTYWEKYMRVYEDALIKCSTDYAPWFVIPSDKKWFRNLVISQIIIDKLKEFNMTFPKPDFDPRKIKVT